jgi:hypothetical protein
MEKVAGVWRRLRNEELHNLYASTIIIKMIKLRGTRWVGHVARVGEMNAYVLVVGKPERKRLLGRHRRRWKDNIRKDVREVGWKGVD